MVSLDSPRLRSITTALVQGVGNLPDQSNGAGRIGGEGAGLIVVADSAQNRPAMTTGTIAQHFMRLSPFYR